MLQRVPSRVSRFLWASAAATAALWVAAGTAQGEGEGRRFSIHPSLTILGVADDNVFSQENGRSSDVGVWISPRVELGYQGRVLEAGADLGADIRRYLNHSSLAKEFFRVNAFGELGLLPGLSLRVSNKFVPQPVELGRPENDTDNLIQSNRTVVRLRYVRELPGRREIEASIQGTRFTTESFEAIVPGTGPKGDFHADYWEGAAFLEVKNGLGRRSSAFARTQFQHRVFDETPLSDHSNISLLVGLRSQWSRNLETEIAGGWGLIAFSHRPNVPRFLGRGHVRYQLPGGWTWKLSVRNKFTADIAGNDFVETSARTGLEKRLGERTSASLSFFLTRVENETWNQGANLFGGGEFRLRRQLNRRIQAVLSYRHWRNGGDYDVDDYRKNTVSLELSYRH